MEKLIGTKTEQNLKHAFAGESMARNKYTYYAKQAIEEGYGEIANVFLETAENEKVHAKLWFKCLNGGEIPTTLENLKDAAQGENEEWTEMYTEFAQIAKNEGFNRIAALFEMVGKIEKEHEKKYRELLDQVEKKSVFIKEEIVQWRCNECGHIHQGKKAPAKCPVCSESQSHFSIKI